MPYSPDKGGYRANRNGLLHSLGVGDLFYCTWWVILFAFLISLQIQQLGSLRRIESNLK